MAQQPLISVVMSVYNGARFLREAMDSMLAQTFANFEFVIINDGSTDGSREIIEGYDDRRIRLYEQENQGIARALNRGIGLARAGLIARMDADDISAPRRLEKEYDFMRSHPEFAVVAAGTALMTEDGRRGPLSFEAGTAWRELGDDDIVRKSLVWHGSVMYGKAEFLEAGGYRPETVPAEDLDLWLRLRQKHPLAMLNELLYYQRRWMRPAHRRLVVQRRVALNYALELDRQRRADGADELQRGRPSHKPAITCEEARRWALIAFGFDLRTYLGARDWRGAWAFARAFIGTDPTSPRVWFLFMRRILSWATDFVRARLPAALGGRRPRRVTN